MKKEQEQQIVDYYSTTDLTGQDEVSKTYSFPKSHVTYRKPRIVSFEQKEMARKQIKMINSKKLYESTKVTIK